MREVFEYPFSNLDPVDSEHVDPPAVAVFEPLLQRGVGGAPEPGLAAHWQVSDDGLTWRLGLRPGATFHSGDVCDAEAVVRALTKCRWSEDWSRQLWYWDPVDEVRAVGDDVEITLLHPCVRLPALLWGMHTAIFNVDRRWRASQPFSPGSADGTGPYRVVEASEEHIRAVTAVTAVGSSADPSLGLEWRALPDRSARRSALERGVADIVRDVDPEWIDGTLAADWRYLEHPENSQYYLALDFDDARGFADIELRRAIEAFIDREEIVAEAFGGRGDARRSPVPVADELAGSYDPADASRLTADQAEAVLRRLGWLRRPDGVRARGADRLAIDCVAPDTDQARRVAGVVQRQLRAAGVDLELRFVGVFDRFYQACAERPAAFINKWLWPDAVEAIIGFSRADCAADRGANWQGARVPEVDRAYDRFLESATAAEAHRRAGDVQRAFMEGLPYIPLCSPSFGHAVRRSVTGFRPEAHALYPSYSSLGHAL
jgi:peptide/nickel transport system substrate-binding protein